jgi:transposase, IS6 family
MDLSLPGRRSAWPGHRRPVVGEARSGGRPALLCRALRAGTVPVEVTTDRASVYPRVLDELVPSALHTLEQYANNPVEADHGRLKARLRPMRGLKRHHSARILAAGHAFVQNLRRGHYDIATDVPSHHRLRVAFDDLALTI